MKHFDQPILVTSPYMPDYDYFCDKLREVWTNKWLTNNGPILRRLMSKFAAYLNVPETNLAIFNNGTSALELGYQAMGLAGGDVITTPFTFVATSHALKRIGATPVFADIDPETLCLDPAKVEPLITSRTKAIVPVHVYGNVCDIAGFDRLSQKYNIPVIYDAAHAFGINVESSKLNVESSAQPSTFNLQPSTSIATCGAMSMFSFHATKIYNTVEGGLLVFNDPAIQNKLFELRNFAIHSEFECTDVGTNAKMNEICAVYGLCCLEKMPDLLAYRQSIYNAYAEVFNNPLSASASNLNLLPHSANKAYIPVVFDSPATCEKVYTELQKTGVFSRRYFYPLLTDFAPYIYARNTCPIAQDIASRVLTLPTYYGLPLEDVKSIAQNVLEIVQPSPYKHGEN